MTQNGHVPAFQLDRLSYGDLRRLQALDEQSPDGQAVMDRILEKAVVGGLDAIPVTAFKTTLTALMEAITEAMSGKEGPAAPSSTVSDAAALEAPAT